MNHRLNKTLRKLNDFQFLSDDERLIVYATDLDLPRPEGEGLAILNPGAFNLYSNVPQALTKVARTHRLVFYHYAGAKYKPVLDALYEPQD